MQIKRIIYLTIIVLVVGCKHPNSNEMKGGYGSTEKNTISLNVIKDDNYEIIKMNNKGGVKVVSLEINDIPLQFIFDTGASSICISLKEVEELVRQGTLSKEDFLGVEHFQDATGKISEGMKINLKKVKIGNTILRDVQASVTNSRNAPLLLGQTALKQFGTIEINNEDDIIILRK